MKTFFLIFTLIISALSRAELAAVVDVSMDFSHQQLASYVWSNPFDILNEADDDHNGKIDDVHGWNFADKNYVLYEAPMEFSEELYAKIQNYFELTYKADLGKASEEEMKIIKQLERKSGPMIDLLAYTSHGTHVSGIMMKDLKKTELIGLRMGSTNVLSFIQEHFKEAMAEVDQATQGALRGKLLRRLILKSLLRRLAKKTNQELAQYTRYLKEKNVRVANCSWGNSYLSLRENVDSMARDLLGNKIPDEFIDEQTHYLFKELNKRSLSHLKQAPSTLFVWAAGNDNREDFQADNDKYPNYPVNTESDNSITVAASINDLMLANFSNYGMKTVHVAAPGVGIVSSSIQNKTLRLSGTSMAAPYVSNVAMKMIEANPAITPKQIKAMIMDTVDKKFFLLDKVASGGVVNENRAIAGAVALKTMEYDFARDQAFRVVPAKFDFSTPSLHKINKAIQKATSVRPKLFY